MNVAMIGGILRRDAEAPARPLAAVMAAVGFIGLAIFELALALGAPLGRAAWGGYDTNLSTGLRVASGVAAVFWSLMGLMVLRRGGYRVPPFSYQVSRVGTWILFGLLWLGVLMNLASGSDWERFLQAPIAAILAVLCFIVGRDPEGGAQRDDVVPGRSGDAASDSAAGVHRNGFATIT